jgi:hypothetical protein
LKNLTVLFKPYPVMPVDRRKTPLTGKSLQAVPGMQKRSESFMTP